jgi:hypothetical protein
MTQAERGLLHKMLANADHYFEFGCGGSTREAAESSVRCITSVDTSTVWQSQVKVPLFTSGGADLWTIRAARPFMCLRPILTALPPDTEVAARAAVRALSC